VRFFLPLSFRQKKAANISSWFKTTKCTDQSGRNVLRPYKRTGDGKHRFEHARRR
jgi:hypothetical protein